MTLTKDGNAPFSVLHGMDSTAYVGPGPTTFLGDAVDLSEFGAADALFINGAAIEAVTQWTATIEVADDLAFTVGVRLANADEYRTQLVAPYICDDNTDSVLRLGIVTEKRFARTRLDVTGDPVSAEDVHTIWIMGHPKHEPVPDQN